MYRADNLRLRERPQAERQVVFMGDSITQAWQYADPALFTGGWIDTMLGDTRVAAADLAATLVELTARTVADACRAHDVAEVVGSGGGLRNPVLVARLRALLAPSVLLSTDDLGLPSDAKEAYLVALLGWLTWHGLPGVVPGGTGSRVPRVLGRITPGTQPLRLPEPLAVIRALEVRT